MLKTVPVNTAAAYPAVEHDGCGAGPEQEHASSVVGASSPKSGMARRILRISHLTAKPRTDERAPRRNPFLAEGIPQGIF